MSLLIYWSTDDMEINYVYGNKIKKIYRKNRNYRYLEPYKLRLVNLPYLPSNITNLVKYLKW